MEESVDIAIRVSRTLPPGFIARKLANAHLLLLASPGYLGEAARPGIPTISSITVV